MAAWFLFGGPMRKIFLITSFLFSCTGLLAGDWGSSGGEFIKDRYNPWFVKDIEGTFFDVKYCLAFDEQGISASKEDVLRITKAAIDYWRSEFAPVGSLTGIGMHNFILQDCDGFEDVKFQFGYGTLSAEQLATFATMGESFENYVGLTIRTAYDKIMLRGKGFIYITSDIGAHAYGKNSNIPPGLFKNDGVLFEVLRHEIGHIMGLPHIAGGVMAADHPENVLLHFRDYRIIRPGTFFAPAKFYTKCGVITPECNTVISSGDWLEGFEVKSAMSIFAGKSTKVSQVADATILHFPIQIFLPLEQKIFERLPNENFLKGPPIVSFKLIANFINGDNESLQLLLDLHPNYVEIYKFDGESIVKFF